MKISTFITVFLISISIMAQTTNKNNPFFQKYNTPHETPPFDKIKTEHYEPAFEEGIKQHDAEIQKIADNTEKPNFTNTIETLERSGVLLTKVSSVFFNLLSAESNDEMQAISQRVSPKLSEHTNNIYLNEKLFSRVKSIHDRKDSLILTNEQSRLLEETYDTFMDKGINLSDIGRDKYRELSAKLSKNTLLFGQNVLKETNVYLLNITDKSELDGLPQSVLDAASLKAKQKNVEGWAFDLSAPSYVPFMKYASNRELRKKLYLAYNTRCINGGETDNREVLGNIVNTRMEIAQLMGYNNYAEYVLRHRMAKNEAKVYDLLNELLTAYRPVALKEYQTVQNYANDSIKGDSLTIMPWDWSYYSDKLKDSKFDINDEMLKPYFELENVKKGVFSLATELYGITFKKNSDIPVYHSEVEAFDVFDADGKFLAVLYTDFHPREGKRSGAWMTEYKGQYKINGIDSRPHISLVMNFTRATENAPALLTYDEVETFLHEFGHSLHGMFADGTYESMSGTNVYRDFVELPSQIMENWGNEKDFLDQFAKHYQTGELIPAELIQKLKNAQNFNAGYLCLRQLSFGFLDMGWYTLTEEYDGDVISFEKNAWKDAMVLPAVEGTCMSAQFNHIFAGGYAAGYYGYKWAEVLDADAFSVFQEKGLFNKDVANSFRNNILSKGNSEDPMTLYVNFRGQEPSITALLKRDGIWQIQNAQIDKILDDYSSIIDKYVSMVKELKKEKNSNKKSQKLEEVMFITPEIQSITKKITEYSDSFTEEQNNRLQEISDKLGTVAE